MVWFPRTAILETEFRCKCVPKRSLGTSYSMNLLNTEILRLMRMGLYLERIEILDALLFRYCTGKAATITRCPDKCLFLFID